MISVIVPVYNTEQYLDRCVQSILAQTYTDFELLLIDDGSTDSSGVICDRYAELDSRVRVFHKENGGVSSARNLGLDNARGEWIAFVDSDDWVADKYLENFISHLNNEAKLIISFSYSVFKNKIYEPKYKSGIIKNGHFDKLFNQYDLSWRTSPWGKLYNKEIIKGNNLQFNVDMPIGEDLVFLYQYLSLIDYIYVCGDSYYYYQADRANTLTKNINSVQVESYCLNNIDKAVANLLQKKGVNGKTAIEKIHYLKYNYINRVLNSLYNGESNKKKRIKMLKTLDYTSYLYFWQLRKKNLKESISVYLIRKRLYYLYDMLRQINNYIKR